MPDIPNTKFIDLVTKPAIIKYDSRGIAQVLLDPTAVIIKVNEFRKVSILIGSTKAISFSVNMGKLFGTTMAQSFVQTVDSSIHTLDIVGPEMSLWLVKGPPNTQENVQLWVYLSS